MPIANRAFRMPLMSSSLEGHVSVTDNTRNEFFKPILLHKHIEHIS